MQNTSTAFKAAIVATKRTLAIKATLQTADTTIYNLGPGDIVSGSLSVSSKIWDDGVELGSTVASDCSISLDNADGRWNDIDLDGATLWPYSGIVLPDTTTEYVKLGTFIIDDPGRPYKQVVLGASDRMILLDEDFANISLTFPATNQQILTAISAYCNVPLAASIATIMNISYSVTTKPESGTCRDIVGMIALLAAGFARMNRDGALEIVQLPNLTGTTNWDMPIGSRYGGFKQTSDEVTLTGLIYTDTEDTVMLGTEDYALKVEQIPILQANRDSILASIWAVINGYTYTGFTCDYPGNPAIDPGDSVTHVTMDGKTIKTLISSHNFVHGGKSTMEATAKSKSEMSYKSANARRLSEISASVAKVKRDFTAYEQASGQFADLMTTAMGFHSTTVIQEDGSIIYYTHDKPTLAESLTIYKQTATAFGWSTDGGVTWNSGYTADGNIFAKILSVIGINANWVNISGRLSSPDGAVYLDLSTGEFCMNGGVNGTLTMSPSNPLRITRPPVSPETDPVFIGGITKILDKLCFIASMIANSENPNVWAEIGEKTIDGNALKGLLMYRLDSLGAKYAASGWTLDEDDGFAIGDSTYERFFAHSNGTGMNLANGTRSIMANTEGTHIYNAHLYDANGNEYILGAVSQDNVIKLLVVAGGGGGGDLTYQGGRCGGGGAGGFIYISDLSIADGTYPVTVGVGGTACSSSVNGNGGNSSIDSHIAYGGGGGAYGDSITAHSGGSGGGAWYNMPSGGGVSGQGNSGGLGYQGANYGGGGGGGAGSHGGSGETAIGGKGGDGLACDISGINKYYAGGGSGDLWGGTGSPNPGAAGLGGGGAGNNVSGGSNGEANTGGGGGSGGGSGGSGVVIIRYKTTSYTCTGGTITFDGPYTVHTFTVSGTFAITKNL